jgi:hypothetical protein
MAFTPTEAEAARLQRAVDLAKFSEFERLLWVSCLLCVIVVEAIMITVARGWPGVVSGALVVVGSFSVLYWRLRGGFLSGRVAGDHGLFTPWLTTREQRAFTGLMLRHVLVGRNPLVPRPEHDPMATWGKVFAAAGDADPDAE